MKKFLGTTLGLLLAAATMMLAPVGAHAQEVADCPTVSQGAAQTGRELIRRLLLTDVQADGTGDNWHREMICQANNWAIQGMARGGDINEDGAIDRSDALIMYYSYFFESSIAPAGANLIRQLLLTSHIGNLGGGSPTADNLNSLVTKAFQLRCDTEDGYTHSRCS